MKRQIIILTAILTLVSCSEWTRTEALETSVRYPWQDDPQLWEEYCQSLKEYKQRSHSIVYARLENSPQEVVNERHFMRCLPDSLDIVTLTNASGFSEYDAEDMAWMKSIGTKVLYHLDLTQGDGDISSAVSSVRDNALDGYSFSLPYRFDDQETAELAASVIDRLRASGEGLLVVFEGNPMAVPADKRDAVDYFVLDCVDHDRVHEITLGVYEALENCSVPKEKLLLSARVGAVVENESKVKVDALSEMTSRVVTYGNLGGLAVYDVEKDYYHYDGNYVAVRTAIQTLNPSR